MPAPNVIQLRQLLADRFPGLRTRADELQPHPRSFWPTGLEALDEPLGGGLIKGTLTEVVAEQRGSGSSLLLNGLIRRALQEKQLVVVVDGCDSLDVTAIDEDLSRLLWVRCRLAEEALKAADLLLRDGNLSLLLIDLVACSPAGLRRISSTTWYRFQRIVEQTSMVCAVFTPRPMVSAAQARITLSSRFSLQTLSRQQEEVLRELKLALSETRRSQESGRRSA